MSSSSAPSPRQSLTSDGAPAIEVRDLTTGYHGHTALEDVSFSLPEGSFLGLLGANGSGKSTLIKSLIGLLDPWQGQVRVFRQQPADVREHVGYVPQAEGIDWLFPVSVREVVAMGLYRRQFGLSRFRRSRSEELRVMATLEKLSMDHLADRQVTELSGGQQRRVLCARALVKKPRLLLLDEPTAGLDTRAERELLDLLATVSAGGATIVMCTHKVGHVSECCDQALLLNRSVLRYGPPDQIFTPEFLSNTLEGQVMMMDSGGDHCSHKATIDDGLHMQARRGRDEHGKT